MKTILTCIFSFGVFTYSAASQAQVDFLASPGAEEAAFIRLHNQILSEPELVGSKILPAIVKEHGEDFEVIISSEDDRSLPEGLDYEAIGTGMLAQLLSSSLLDLYEDASKPLRILRAFEVRDFVSPELEGFWRSAYTEEQIAAVMGTGVLLVDNYSQNGGAMLELVEANEEPLELTLGIQVVDDGDRAEMLELNVQILGFSRLKAHVITHVFGGNPVVFLHRNLATNQYSELERRRVILDEIHHLLDAQAFPEFFDDELEDRAQRERLERLRAKHLEWLNRDLEVVRANREWDQLVQKLELAVAKEFRAAIRKDALDHALKRILVSAYAEDYDYLMDPAEVLSRWRTFRILQSLGEMDEADLWQQVNRQFGFGDSSLTYEFPSGNSVELQLPLLPFYERYFSALWNAKDSAPTAEEIGY